MGKYFNISVYAKNIILYLFMIMRFIWNHC